jgi:hypothetical protein
MFLAVANHLLHQGRRAVDENNECVYLSEDGLKCAAGCLLPEEHYDEDIEGAYVTDEQVIEHFNMAGVNLREQANLDLIRKLQTVHDDSDPKDWYDKLMDIAADESFVAEDGMVCHV